MKLMYPAKLGVETKCPYCKSGIIPIGGGSLFNCQNGHIVECVVMVTLTRADTAPKAEQSAITHPRPDIRSNISTDEPILPPKAKTN